MSGDMLMLLRAKLHPGRFSRMSDKMAALVGHFLDADWTDPAIRELAITSDGIVVADGQWIGSVEDLDRNWSNLLKAADLTDAEYAFAMLRYRDGMVDFRRGRVH